MNCASSARRMIQTAREAGIRLGVVSQHRFDDATLFLSRAIAKGRLGRILQADAYVKWYRTPEYYSRPIKGSWHTEGGGAMINQAIELFLPAAAASVFLPLFIVAGVVLLKRKESPARYSFWPLKT